MKKYLLCSMLLLSQAALFAAAQTLTDSVLSGKISQFVSEREAGLASVAVGVFNGGQTVHEGYYGYADIDAKLKAGPETVYEWGSVSKLLVWVSVMQLWERGMINLDADIHEYLPSAFLKDFAFDDKVTMIHLMNHTAGFQECVYQNENAEEKDIKPLGETLQKLQPRQVYRPGEMTAYSNWGCALAAFIIQNVSGMDYIEYVHENILEPLGMTRTAVSASHADNVWAKERRELLKTYSITSEGREDFGTCVSYVDVYPAGAVISTLSDMVVFAKALANPSSVLFASAETHRAFLSATSFFGDSDLPKNCHGMWTAFYGRQMLGHGGNTIGCTANLLFDPESGDGIVVMANECGESAFCYGLPALVFGDADFTDSTSLAQEQAADISGFYTMSRGFKKGFMNMAQYMFFMPVFRTKNPDVFKIGFGGSISYKGGNRYIMDNGNGMTAMLYLSKGSQGRPVLEMMSCDYIRDAFFVPKLLLIILMIVLAVASLVVLLVKGIMAIVMKLRNRKGSASGKVETKLSTAILANLSLAIPPVIAVILYRMFCADQIVLSRPFSVFSAVLAGLVCLSSVANMIYLLRKKRYCTAAVSFYAAFFITFFQFYDFWSC